MLNCICLQVENTRKLSQKSAWEKEIDSLKIVLDMKVNDNQTSFNIKKIFEFNKTCKNLYYRDDLE